MLDDRRLKFVRKWLERAKKEEDEFDRFFAAWIALVVASQRLRDHTGSRYDSSTDREKVLEYFDKKSPSVLKAIENRRVEMVNLSGRRGSGHGNAIVDSGDPEFRDRMTRLAKHYRNDVPMLDADRVRAVGEMLNRIRNNIFHGIKIYDDREDLELLRQVNPLLLEILTRCEGEGA